MNFGGKVKLIENLVSMENLRKKIVDGLVDIDGTPADDSHRSSMFDFENMSSQDWCSFLLWNGSIEMEKFPQKLTRSKGKDISKIFKIIEKIDLDFDKNNLYK